MSGPTQCSDKQDNDHDGQRDLSDPDCTNASDDNEAAEPTAQCSNGQDDDGDGKTDYDGHGQPENRDPDCTDASDDQEAS